ncbi:MAG: SPFH domain-containing protein [Candidatus Hodarchaeota archaeon]
MSDKRTISRENIDFSNNNRKRVLLYGSLIGLLIVSGGIVGYFFLAFDSIGYNQYGLNQNDLSQQIEDRVYEKGLYHIGLLHHFIKFPKTVQKIEFFDTLGEPGDTYGPLNSRTKDGLMIHIQLAFHYRLRKDDILSLYSTFALDYEDRFVGQARTTIRDVASLFNAIEFFNNRSSIGDLMQLELTTDIDIMYAEIVYFQMREIDLPDEFEEALKQVQIAQQQYQIALYEQQAAIVTAQTAIIEAQAQANITVLSAEASAEAYIIQMNATAQALNITLRAESLAYYAMGQQLNLTSSELLTLLWIKAITEHDQSLLIIGADTPIILQQEFNTTKGIY